MGRNNGPRFLKGRLALCMAYDSGVISLPYEPRDFSNNHISIRGKNSDWTELLQIMLLVLLIYFLLFL